MLVHPPANVAIAMPGTRTLSPLSTILRAAELRRVRLRGALCKGDGPGQEARLLSGTSREDGGVGCSDVHESFSRALGAPGSGLLSGESSIPAEGACAGLWHRRVATVCRAQGCPLPCGRHRVSHLRGHARQLCVPSTHAPTCGLQRQCSGKLLPGPPSPP